MRCISSNAPERAHSAAQNKAVLILLPGEKLIVKGNACVATNDINGNGVNDRFSRTLTKTTGFTDIEAYEFRAGTKTKTVLWSSVITTEASAPCASQRAESLATFGSGVARLRVVDYLGKQTIITDNSAADLDTRVGYIAIAVKNAPVIAQPNP